MEDDVKQASADRYALSQAYRWRAERDTAMQELRQLKDSSRDTTMSAYDLLPEEERDAIAWVREHGGLDSVKKLLDWVVGHCSTKQQLDFDFWLSGRVMYELGFDDDMADRGEVERRLLARLIPEGYEWPRYETGELLRYKDRYIQDGAESEVWHVDFDSYGEATILNRDYSKCSLDKGERVKRPAPKVLDADGVEVEVGDDLYSVEGMLKFHVSAIDKKSGRIATEAMFALDKWADPKMYTHRAPVLAADGLPLREGETVWDVLGNRRFKVLGFGSDAKLGEFTVKTAGIDGMSLEGYSKPSDLTHERPDSYDALWEDIEECAVGYSEFMRRVKALAGGA